MKLHDLKQKLIENGVPSEIYHLSGGFPNEAYCVDNNGFFWEVYYSERGVKSGLKQFEVEDQACDYIYELIMHSGFSLNR